jgi:hypothetical protein
MTEQPQVPDETADEYDYDLAHDETIGRPTTPPVQAPQRPPDMHATGNDGDYGHDLAHDMG